MKKLLLILLIAICGIANAQFTKILDFNGTNGTNPNGDLLTDGTYLYGMTSYGGINSKGVIFKIKPDGTGYADLLDFNGANGANPYGSLIFDGTYLYGMTSQGGTGIYSTGVIFKIKPDGTGYAKLLDFNGANGENPYGSLISDGTFLYGMTKWSSGAYGTIFKIKPDGTGYVKLIDFTGANGNNPYGSLISDGTFLYGMTYAGGTGYGTIFKIKKDGTGYTLLRDLGTTNDGHGPKGTLISDGTYLYGMTNYGGTFGYGTIFKIKPDGTGYINLYVFDFARSPLGSLSFDGTFLYGMTSDGGINYKGVIFKIKPDGTGYSRLFDFSDANGSVPNGSLISDGTCLYGMTQQGGTFGGGTIFEYCPVGMGVVENNDAIDFTIYPNPTNGNLQLAVGNMQLAKGELEIYNVYGEKVYEDALSLNGTNAFSVSLPSGLGQGIYFLQIKTTEGTATKKLIIQK